MNKARTNIAKVCECDTNNTELCHSWTGKCVCKAGWDGDTCARPCPFYTYGKGCQNHCNCKNNAQCSPVNGTCICAAGYRGENCSDICPVNTYGEDCEQKCACKNGATCSPENGRCNCTAGNTHTLCYKDNAERKLNGICDRRHRLCVTSYDFVIDTKHS